MFSHRLKSLFPNLMPTIILSGKVIADEIKAEVAAETASLKQEHGIEPCLVAVRVGEDPASSVYVNSKVKTAAELGLVSEHKHVDADISEAELADNVAAANDNGILAGDVDV